MPLKIVYLDDEPDVSGMFADNFASKEIEIKTFVDPDLALAYIHAHPPDVVFLDYRMPNTNGDLVAQAIKIDVPKVLVTGDLEVKTVTQFTRKFTKPFPWDEMEQFLDSLVKKKAA